MPVANVSFEEALRFCQQLSHGAKHFTLPSKADWLAAAGLSAAEVASAWDILCKQGRLQHEVTSLDRSPTLSAPARGGSRGAQTNGLCDLFGNLREWVREDGGDRGEIAGFCFYSKFNWTKALLLGPQQPSSRKQETGFRCFLRERNGVATEK
jgi:formylglycine-generating enzyme required for sulfatase activity